MTPPFPLRLHPRRGINQARVDAANRTPSGAPTLCGRNRQGLQNQAADVGEKRAVFARNALLRDENKKSGKSGANFVAGSQFGVGTAEKDFGDGPHFDIVTLVGEIFVEGAKSEVRPEDGIAAALSVGRGEKAIDVFGRLLGERVSGEHSGDKFCCVWHWSSFLVILGARGAAAHRPPSGAPMRYGRNRPLPWVFVDRYQNKGT